MLDFIWVSLVVVGVGYGMVNGTLGEVQEGLFSSAANSVELAIGLVGMMAFWMGLMSVAQSAGLTKKLSQALSPLLKWLFPHVPEGHPAMEAMSLNLSANLLGLGNGATPFGLKAMEELQGLNPSSNTATDAMIMFLVLNTSSLTLVSSTLLALRTASGSADPTAVVGPIFLTTALSTTVAILCTKGLAFLSRRRQKKEGDTLW